MTPTVLGNCMKRVLFIVFALIMHTQAHAIAFEATEEAQAFKKGDIKTVKRLVEKDNYFKDDHKHTVEALYFAIDSGNLELIKYLASQGWLDICRKESLCAPIYAAAYYEFKKSKPMIEFFISQGFSPVAANAYGATPLHAAAQHSADIDLVRYLCELGVDASVRGGYYKRTALEKAVNSAGAGSLSPNKQEDARIRQGLKKVIAYLESGQCKKK